MVFDGPKQLKNIEKQTLFLIFGHCQKHRKNNAKVDLKIHVFYFPGLTWISSRRSTAEAQPVICSIPDPAAVTSTVPQVAVKLP